MSIPPLTISVGQNNEQINGSSDRTIQAGVDYLARLGGGTLRIGPGVYHFTNSIILQSNIRIEGCGEETVLMKNASHRSTLIEDADWYSDSVVVEDPSGFEIGHGIVLQAKDSHSGSDFCFRFTIIGLEGNRLLLDRQLTENFWTDCEGSAATLFPILCGENVSNIEIGNLVLDGNKEENEELNGNYGGGFFMQNCEQIRLDSVTSQNYRGDGFSWQVVHDLSITNCRSLNNTNLGLHPGSGSQRPVIKNNQVEGGNIGLYFCWGVKNGIAENNRIVGSETGISIGHRDTDNVVLRNEVIQAKGIGLQFRDHKIPDRNGHRNLIEDNLFSNCGPDGEAKVIEINGLTRSITIRNNTFEETREDANARAIIIGPAAEDIQIEGNTFTGFDREVVYGEAD